MIGFPLIAAFLLLATGIWSGTWRVAQFLWLGGCGMAAGALFAAIPSIAKPFYLLLHLVACCISIVVGNALLAAFYLLILTPVGVTMRVFGRQPLGKKFDRETQSYWVDVEKSGDVGDYYRQF